MTFYRANGTRLVETALTDVTDPVANPDTQVVVLENIYQSFTQDGGKFEGASRLLLVEGQIVSQSYLDGLFPTATVASITPNTGGAAGGTPVVIKGTNFSGSAGATVGGVALTNFKVVDATTITGTTGAHAAGAVALVVQDDGGNVTVNNAFTYA